MISFNLVICFGWRGINTLKNLAQMLLIYIHLPLLACLYIYSYSMKIQFPRQSEHSRCQTQILPPRLGNDLLRTTSTSLVKPFYISDDFTELLFFKGLLTAIETLDLSPFCTVCLCNSITI